MTIQEFVERQAEFIGKTVVFRIRWRAYGDGEIVQIKRKVVAEEEYHVPDSETFKVLEVEVED